MNHQKVEMTLEKKTKLFFSAMDKAKEEIRSSH
jgi:hypothetical protein